MMRSYVGGLSLMACAALNVADSARAEPLTSAPVCLYDSKSYSDGAFICAQKSLMLTCSSDGAHATWKVVADKDLSDRCVAPIALSSPPLLRRRVHGVHSAHHMVHRATETPAAETSARCFHFNGRQYCE